MEMNKLLRSILFFMFCILLFDCSLWCPGRENPVCDESGAGVKREAPTVCIFADRVTVADRTNLDFSVVPQRLFPAVVRLGTDPATSRELIEHALEVLRAFLSKWPVSTALFRLADDCENGLYNPGLI
jgi:hypothetical protein